MIYKKIAALTFAALLSVASSFNALADTTNTLTMENSGAYLFEWRPVDCGNGQSFAILKGGNSIAEYNVILSRGYDYAYTFDPSNPRPWGTVPDLVCIDGVWGIPENWALLPEGAQPTTRITLITNNKNLSTRERYVDVVHLPSSVDSSKLPAEVRKYLINVDGSDAGAYDGTETTGWTQDENGNWKYRKPDKTFVTNSWLTVDDKTYYLDENGIMLADTITPDGIYVNTKGEKTSYIPGWVQDEKGWRYLAKNGYYAASTWLEVTEGKWYYFTLNTYMLADTTTPDGYYVDATGAWDGVVPESVTSNKLLGPGVVEQDNSGENVQETADAGETT